MRSIPSDYLHNFIENALREDIGSGDHSSLACIPEGKMGKAKLLIKEKGILAGVNVAEAIFKTINPEAHFEISIEDGGNVHPGDIAFTVTAPVHTILAGERLTLNCMQRMSGIATFTGILSKKIAHTRCRLLDTRKTTPGIRALEKYAVTCGGGHNHRMGLYDMIMLKDNHIDYAGGIRPAIDRVRDYLHRNNIQLPIEVEARSMKEVEEIIAHGPVDRIMLDNFTPQETQKAIQFINGRSETEASGGISENTIVAYAETGVDFISVGALTHSVKSLDMSLKAMDV
jgi:nicotinate-nucleotide pyrophosphorylase (carboxylating)